MYNIQMLKLYDVYTPYSTSNCVSLCFYFHHHKCTPSSGRSLIKYTCYKISPVNKMERNEPLEYHLWKRDRKKKTKKQKSSPESSHVTQFSQKGQQTHIPPNPHRQHICCKIFSASCLSPPVKD